MMINPEQLLLDSIPFYLATPSKSVIRIAQYMDRLQGSLDTGWSMVINLGLGISLPILRWLHTCVEVITT